MSKHKNELLETPEQDNQELLEMFEEDQASRAENRISQEEDVARLKRVKEMLQKEVIKTPKDYYNAAMIFQHGETPEDYENANKPSEKSMEMGYSPAKWLYAASYDRWQLSKGEKYQKYGTQFRKDEEGVWRLLPIDPKTTDEERAKYGIPNLEKQKEREKELNSEN